MEKEYLASDDKENIKINQILNEYQEKQKDILDINNFEYKYETNSGNTYYKNSEESTPKGQKVTNSSIEHIEEELFLQRSCLTIWQKVKKKLNIN